MSIRSLFVASTLALSTVLGGCAVMGDATSDPGGKQRIAQMGMLTQGLNSIAASRSGGVGSLGSTSSPYRPGYAPSSSAGVSASTRKCRDPEAVCSLNDSRCIAQNQGLPLCRR